MHRRRRPRRTVLLALPTVAIISAAACGRPGATGVAPSPSVLGSADTELIAALLQIADARRSDTLLIDRALTSASSRVRALALRTIGQVRIRARAGALRARLSDPDSATAADAAFALGLLRDTAAVAALGQALARPPTVRDAAAWALGEIGEPARASLTDVLRTGRPVTAVAAVLQAATKLRPVPVDDVARYLLHDDPGVRRGAAYALTRSRVPSSARVVLAAANRSDENSGDASAELNVEFRSYLARGLALPVVGDSLAQPAVAALERLVDDAHPHVRINAIRSLATFGEAARASLLRHVRDPDPNARITVAQSLTGVLPASSSAWTDVWGADTGFTYRRSLVSSAMRSGVRLPPLASSGADAWHLHPEWRYRSAAAEAAALGGFSVADEVAGSLLADIDPRVRNAALGALIPFADSARASRKRYARGNLPQLLGDPDLFVRATTLNALRDRARARDASLALSALRAASRDPENDARVAALRVIASAWRADSTSFSAALIDSLEALPAPPDPAERAAVLRIAPFRGWPAIEPGSRALSWYSAQVREIVARDVAGRPMRASIVTDRGRLELVFYGSDAPLTVANFVALARRGYYNGLGFHRVVPNFVAQDGDPRGDGGGGPGYAIRDELNRRWYDRGAVGMALSGPDTGGSQYFIAHSPQPHLDGHYTVFGHLTDGLAVLDALVQGDRIHSVTIR